MRQPRGRGGFAGDGSGWGRGRGSGSRSGSGNGCGAHRDDARPEGIDEHGLVARKPELPRRGNRRRDRGARRGIDLGDGLFGSGEPCPRVHDHLRLRERQAADADGTEDNQGEQPFGQNNTNLRLVGRLRKPAAGARRIRLDSDTLGQMAGLRLLFFGLPLAPHLLLRDGHDVRLAVLSPVDAPGRRRVNKVLGPSHVLEARWLPGRLEQAIEQALGSDEIDLVVSWFWTRRLPPRWLTRGRLGAIGVHPSLLPRHRGPNPYFWAIDSGDEESGVTVHELTERYDDGAVLGKAAVRIGDRDSWQLARALDRPSLALLRDVISRIAGGSPPVPVPQDEAGATWAPEPEGDALHVDFQWSTERVLRRVRALAPVPGALLDVEGLELTVLRACPADDFPQALLPGEAAVVGDPPRLVIRTGSGAIALERATLDQPLGTGATLDGPALGRLAAEHLGRVRPQGV